MTKVLPYTPGQWFVSSNGYRIRKVRIRPKHRIVQFEHRLVMEQHLGRKLAKDEVVHHKNRNRLDNRIENLEVLTPSEHTKHHFPRARLEDRYCQLCGVEIPKERKLNRGKGVNKKVIVKPFAKSVWQFKKFCSKVCAGKNAMAVRWGNNG